MILDMIHPLPSARQVQIRETLRVHVLGDVSSRNSLGDATPQDDNSSPCLSAETRIRVTTRVDREKALESLDFTDQIDEIYTSRSTRVAGRQDDAIEIQPKFELLPRVVYRGSGD